MPPGKAKTTMNKLNRERKVRERRLDKEARKAARANLPEGEQAQDVDHLQYWIEGTEQPGSSETPAES